ncbi:MAG: acyl-CoA dehydrogenase, partial [Gemmatimonadota bacterium]|nr:acyl-CoA dehydrogenase [Gemmatimonadota bacterium]
RDAQVLPIWEGTTNVLSLDVLRAIDKTGALDHFLADVRARMGDVDLAELAPAVERVRHAADRIEAYAGHAAADTGLRQAGARAFAYAIARTCAASLLVEDASSCPDVGERANAMAAATRWSARDLAPLEEHRLVSL